MSTDFLLGHKSIETDEKICYEPNSGLFDGESSDYLIFFITGNPGLISYYQPFLFRLRSLLDSTSGPGSASFHICGHSFKGMEFAKDEAQAKPPTSPLSLGSQIDYQEDLLYGEVNSYRDKHGKSPKVILMGHSVGSYILLEIIKRHRDRIHSGDKDFDLIGGILLFPTITHIAQSPLGMVACVSRESRLSIMADQQLSRPNIENPRDPSLPSYHGVFGQNIITCAACKPFSTTSPASNEVSGTRSKYHCLVHQKSIGGSAGFVSNAPIAKVIIVR